MVIQQENEKLYDSLWKLDNGTDKFGNVGVMADRVKEFHNYIGELKRKFYQACGDSSGEQLPATSEYSMTLSGSFFMDKHSVAHSLLNQLQSVTSTLDKHATNELAKGMIHKLRSVTVEKFASPEEFLGLYFKSAPPVVAITILNSFEMQVKAIEGAILKDYLNNK